MPFLPSLPADATFGDIRAVFADPMARLYPFAESLMYGPGPFTLAEREMIAAYVSGLNACRYCYGTHAAAARAHGADPDLLEALVDDPATAPIAPAWQPLLALLRKQTEAPARIVEADVAAALAAGWAEDAVARACMIGAYYNMLNRLLDAFGIVAGEDYYREAGTRLAGVGRDARDRLDGGALDSPAAGPGRTD